MKIEIEGKKENPLLERTEVSLSVEHEATGTPTRDELRKQLAGMLGAEEDTVVIDIIKTEFGHQMSKVYAKVYDSFDSAKRFEKEYMLARNRVAEEKEK